MRDELTKIIQEYSFVDDVNKEEAFLDCSEAVEKIMVLFEEEFHKRECNKYCEEHGWYAQLYKNEK